MQGIAKLNWCVHIIVLHSQYTMDVDLAMQVAMVSVAMVSVAMIAAKLSIIIPFLAPPWLDFNFQVYLAHR